MRRVLLCFAYFGFIHADVVDLSCDTIREFVNGHNARRLQVAKHRVPGHPGAMNMKYLIWDEELATKAADWASNGVFQHNPDTSIDSDRFQTGENLYIYKTTDQDYDFDSKLAMDAWFVEYKDWRFKPLTNDDFTSEKEIGHYTQMVWADSTYLGCAINHYQDSNDWNTFLVVCNYGPAGNYIGQTPYKAGKGGKGSGKLTCGISDCSNMYGDSC